MDEPSALACAEFATLLNPSDTDVQNRLHDTSIRVQAIVQLKNEWESQWNASSSKVLELQKNSNEESGIIVESDSSEESEDLVSST
jgi:hypothetical protein